jgi:hypothetical protein
LFWAALFVLYLPAAKAGWVSDTLGWLQAVRTQSFYDFVARKGFGVPSFYQLTQIVTWSLYQVFGANAWAWHLLQLSLHALNSLLLFTFLRGLFQDSEVRSAEVLAFVAAALFCTSPYVSEVIVWEAAYHFLQGLLLVLAQLHFLRRLLHGRGRYVSVAAVVLFALSLFSLEFFYLVPLLNAVFCLYYFYALGWDKAVIRKAWWQLVVPQAALLILYFIGLRVFAGATTGRLGNAWMQLPITYYLVKPPEYLFHLLGGRFLPQAWRSAYYHVCSSYVGAGIFYLSIGSLLAYILLRFRKMKRRMQLISLLTIWLVLSLALVTPLWFPERLLIVGDRYLYLLLPPFLALLVLLVATVVRKPSIQQAVFGVLFFQMPFTYQLARIWKGSDRLSTQLQQRLPDAPDKITILLNNPASLRGALMIGAGSDGEGRLMHNLFYPDTIKGVMYDAPAQNLLHPTDSIRIKALDSQTIKVSLTQPGAFWQYSTDVAKSFSNEDFDIQVADPYCCYVLHLNGQADRYRLLFQQSGIWHEFHIPVTGRQMP